MPRIEIAQPTAAYTPGAADAHVQFDWRVAATGGTPASGWHRESYSPSQAQLATRAPAELLAIAPGHWGDAEVRGDVKDFMAAQFGFTDVTFLGTAAVAS